jgi:uncharacterized protein YkwD
MKKWILIIFVFVLIPASVLGFVLIKKPKSHKPAAHPASAAPASSSQQKAEPEVQLDTAEIHQLINQQRTKAGLKALTVNDDLYDSALAKCQDMQKNNYFTHKSPSGQDYNSFIMKAVPHAKTTGENLGAGYTDTNQLVNDWMQSDEHKGNILNPKFTAEAIATCGKSNIKPGLIIVDHFIQL